MKERVILPKYRQFPFKAMSDLQGSSIQTTSSHVASIRSIDRNILIQDLHNILDVSIDSSNTNLSNRSTSSKTDSFRSPNEGGTGSEEEPTSAQEERGDGGGGGDQDDQED